jgi:hypothetical protein
VKFLVDEAISARFSRLLARADHDVQHVGELGLLGAGAGAGDELEAGAIVVVTAERLRIPPAARRAARRGLSRNAALTLARSVEF